MVRDFINNPDDFLHAKNAISELQTGNNPFGDYAPKSGQIQGVLKGMYDDFTGSLEKANVEESNKQKSFEELMETKKKEEKALASTLQRSEKSEAESTKSLADSRSNLDDTKEQLEADQDFFARTKDSCKKKAQAWAERTRLRAEELQGMTTAIAILTSDDAKKTFKNATKTFFLQLSSSNSQAETAYAQLRQLHQKFGGLALAQIAAEARAGGHFDKVIHMIENMILKLIEEGKEDVRHRDRCETKQDENKKNMEDLKFDIGKLKDKLGRFKNKKKELEADIKKTESNIKKSEKTIKEMQDQRAKEFDNFSQATKDDLEAIRLISEAIASLSKFYKDNNIPMTNLMQSQGKPPETWEDDKYGGKKSASTGILAILSMIKEDLENEVNRGKETDAASQENFSNDLQAANEALDAYKQRKADNDKELAEVLRQINYRGEDKDDKNDDLDGEKDIKKALAEDCDWIKTDFDKRVKKRKLEIEGLKEAKHFLGGATVLHK